MGVESDTNAWSAYGGRWRSVRITYPRYWPPAWGLEPLLALAVGIAVVVGSAGVAVILGVAVAIMAASDLAYGERGDGAILRLRSFGDDRKQRYFVAVDDGGSRRIRAFRVSPHLYERLEQDEVVTVRTTSNLGCVRWIIPASEAD
jgi:hypothetical protein